MKSAYLAALILIVSGCTIPYEPPTLVRPHALGPDTGYIEADGTAEEAWEAVLDLIADYGLTFDFLDGDQRIARISGVIAPGALAVLPTSRQGIAGTQRSRISELAQDWADCGTLDGFPVAGLADLRADISIRVREYQNRGFMKVVAPAMWVRTTTRGDLRCVSTGRFEEAWEQNIKDRVELPVRRQ